MLIGAAAGHVVIRLESTAAVSGRLSVHEPVVHSFANWVLDRMIGGG